jgi:GTP-binding protein
MDVLAQIRVLYAELVAYSEDLAQKPRWLVLNKADLRTAEEIAQYLKMIKKELKWKAPVFVISAITRQGLPDLVDKIATYLKLNHPS